MPFCQHCGQELSPDAKFCPKCGTAIEKEDRDVACERKQVFEGEIRKCPNCGEVLKAFEATCPTCGYELRGSHAVGAIQEFVQKLGQIETEYKLMDVGELLDKDSLSIADERKINLIRNFAVPNTKEDIFEFLILASSNVTTMQNMFDVQSSYSKVAVCEAWEAKFEQVYNKAKLTFGEEKEFEKIQEIYRKMQISVWKKNVAQAIRGFLRFAVHSPALAIGLILLFGGFVANIIFPHEPGATGLLMICGIVILIRAARRGTNDRK